MKCSLSIISIIQIWCPITHSCKNLKQKSEETFKEYAQRWRELVAKVQPSLFERELVDMFMGNLQGPYLDRMVGSTSSSFSVLVLAEETIENMIKMGEIQNSISTFGVVKKSFVVYGKKREKEMNETAVIRVRASTYRVSYQQVVVIAPVQQQQQ